MWPCSKYNLRRLNIVLHIATMYTVFVAEVPILGLPGSHPANLSTGILREMLSRRA